MPIRQPLQPFLPKGAALSLLASLFVFLSAAAAPLQSQAAPTPATTVSASEPPAEAGAATLPAYLKQTLGGRAVQHKTLPFFKDPAAHAGRWQAIRQYFSHRFGIADAQQHVMQPQIIVLHSTESESENSAYQTFAYGSVKQYLGGVWTHFAIDARGQIVQYSPLNRISKGQAGVNDIALGIELVGSASVCGTSSCSRRGSIMQRYLAGNSAQLAAAADLVATLQQQAGIPGSRIFSHQEVASLKWRGEGTSPDYNWLKSQIKDRVYLGQVADQSPSGQLTRKYPPLDPYGRSDPGLDVMETLFQLLTSH
ncbi:MAG: N-acetylmuramoyl-L-alanine amidase [Candidatus Sericytochromatia bacterium]|nr:N-acetylmuramoyl-L-alanine amidase [Candidatus Sericytochromatia bacterium]